MTFQPGNNMNPGGKPKQKPIAEAMRHMLLSGAVKKCTIGRKTKFKVTLPEKPRPLDYVAAGILEDAINGLPSARQLLLDRTEGKVPLPVVGSNDDAPPIQTQDRSLKEIARVIGFLLLDNQPQEEPVTINHLPAETE